MNLHPASLAIALVLGTRLTLAPGAGAQPPAAEDAAPLPQRLAIGGSIGAVWMFPTFGALVSVPAADWLAVEATVNRVYGAVLTQGQVRIPLVRDRPTKRNLIVGLGHMSGRGRQFTEGLLGHAGISFQQAMARRLDLRLDLQMLMPFQGGPDADPRAAVAVVWRPLDRSRGAAIPSRAIVALPIETADAVTVPDPPLARVPPRFELAATGGMIAGPPTAGGLVGVPLPGGGAVEGAFEGQTRLGDGSRWAFTQAQLRWPIGRNSRFRASAVLGITKSTKVVPERATTAIVTPPIEHDWICSTQVCPHGGVSLQRPLRRRLDLRLDFQALLADRSRMIPYPRAAVGLVLFRGLS